MASGNVSSLSGEIQLDIEYHVTSYLLVPYRFTFSLLHGSDKRFERWSHMAENIYSQYDSQGRQFQMMEDIIKFRTNGDALTDIEDSTVLLNGIRHPIATTKGWSFLVQWKRGEATWVPLKDLKKSNPI